MATVRAELVVVAAAAVAAALAAALLPGWGGAAAALAVAVLAVTGVRARLREHDERVAAAIRGLPRVQDARQPGLAPPLRSALAATAAVLEERSRSLAADRERVELLLESLPTAILLFSETGLAYVNPAAQRLFGVPPDEPLSPRAVLGVEALAGAVVEAREAGGTVDVEASRDERFLVGRASAIGGDTVALVVSDVTESRRLEAVRRDFVTNASHELKTPVAGMQALADSLVVAVDRDPHRARTMLGRLQSEAVRLADLVRDLLDLSRLEEDAAAQSGRRRVELGTIVEEQIERLAPLAEERGVTLVRRGRASASLVAIPADLRLIVANLLENAIRYNRPGGWVEVRLDRERGEVVLEVTDNGIGIPEADRDRVFERFYRVDKGRSRAAGGTGLGLSIARHAAARHGGEVTVRSVLGEGSTFRVVLPVEGSAPSRA